jgi:hypothetical protein
MKVSKEYFNKLFAEHFQGWTLPAEYSSESSKPIEGIQVGTIILDGVNDEIGVVLGEINALRQTVRTDAWGVVSLDSEAFNKASWDDVQELMDPILIPYVEFEAFNELPYNLRRALTERVGDIDRINKLTAQEKAQHAIAWKLGDPRWFDFFQKVCEASGIKLEFPDPELI